MPDDASASRRDYLRGAAALAGAGAATAGCVSVPFLGHERDNLLHEVTYDTGDYSQAEGVERHEINCSGGDVLQVVEREAEGEYASKHELLYCDERSEVRTPNVEIGGTYWYGWQYYVPESFAQEGWTICAQWLCWPCENEMVCGGAGSKMSVDVEGWTLDVQHHDPGGGTECDSFDLGGLSKGTWTDFVAEVTWSGGDDGAWRLWKDGEQVVDYEGPTFWDDEGEGPYFKVGAYKGHSWGDRGDPEPVVLYTDEIRIGSASATYEDVAPP